MNCLKSLHSSFAKPFNLAILSILKKKNGKFRPVGALSWMDLIFLKSSLISLSYSMLLLVQVTPISCRIWKLFCCIDQLILLKETWNTYSYFSGRSLVRPISKAVLSNRNIMWHICVIYNFLIGLLKDRGIFSFHNLFYSTL